MPRYLMTHSLLSSWLYAMKGNPYEDATTEKDSFAEFMATLRREPTPTNEAMQKGIDFEDLVTSIVEDETEYGFIDGNAQEGMPTIHPADIRDHPWYNAAAKIAEIARGGLLQFKVKKEIVVSGIAFLLYGRLDILKAGVIYDIKFSSSYEKGKYVTSTQHPTYLELVPQAREFTYLVSNGSAVWKETYRREETSNIANVISDFVEWLEANELLDVYKEHWAAL